MGLPADLPAFVKEADIVVNTLPLTAETRGMFDAAIFGAMKRTAFFVNVGRGGTVVTEALLKALQDGTIGGAGLDVVDPEPLPAGIRCGRLRGSSSRRTCRPTPTSTRRSRWLLIRENLRRFVAGGNALGGGRDSRLLKVEDPGAGQDHQERPQGAPLPAAPASASCVPRPASSVLRSCS